MTLLHVSNMEVLQAWANLKAMSCSDVGENINIISRTVEQTIARK